MLYQWEVGSGTPSEVTESYWMLEGAVAGASPAIRALAADLVLGTIGRVPEIDPLIAASADNWRITRMAVVDRLILRLAVFELLGGERTPPSVVIDEALELARTYSTEEAVKFVNGVLDAVHRKVGPATEVPPAAAG
jgi:N utilization substance protein B